MKKCPKCNKTWPDEYDGCPDCGVDLIDIDKSPMDNHTSNTSTGSAQSDSHERSTVNVGNDNAIAGGVHSTDNSNRTISDSYNTTKNNSDNTTNNTTIYEAKKSDIELFNENLFAFRLECKRQYKNGLISKDGKDILLELQRKCNLPDESVKPIEDEIREISRTPIKQIPQTVIYEINNTKSIIELNFPNAIQNQLVKFKSWVKEYDNDTLKFWYYHLSSMLEPARFTELYETSVKDEYWEVFWAFIAYMLQNKVERAYDAHALLGRLQPFYPEMHEQNDVVLMISGHLIQNDSIEDIKRAYNTHAIYCTKELIPLLNSIDCLLQMDWTRESPTIPSTQSFYVNTLFKSFVETQKKRGEEIRIETGRISREEMEKQKELRDQKAALLDKFQELKNVEKACKVLDIPYYTTFQDWLNEDPSFRTKYNEIVCRIDEGSKECAEQEERLRRQKDDFKLLYKQNNCDTLKTCSDLGIGRDTVEDWKKSDSAFTDALAIIDREHKKQLQELFIQFYEANGCDVQKSCAETGICEDEYSDWRRSDKSFAEVLSAIEREHIKELKDAFVECYGSNYNVLSSCKEVGLSPDDIRVWRKQDEAFNSILQGIEQKRNNELKDAFIKCYGANNCDIQTACKETTLSPDDIKTWRKQDSAFHNTLCNIEREHKKRRIKKFVSKVLPCILIVILILSIACMLKKHRQAMIEADHIEQMEKERQLGIQQKHDELVKSFNLSFSAICLDDSGVDSLQSLYSILEEIKSYETTYQNYVQSQYESLRAKMNDKCDQLIRYYKREKTTLEENPIEQAKITEHYGTLEEKVKSIKSKI